MKALLPHAHQLRLRCLASLPMVGVAGAALGAAIAHGAEAPVGSTALWFAAALCATSFLSAILEGATLAALGMDPEGMAADVAGFGWDGVLGVAAGVLLSRITSSDTLQAAGAASAILFVQRLVVEKLLLGNLIGDSFLAVLQGGGVRREPDYSRAAALGARGEYDAARREYENAIADEPQNVRPYVALARMLRDDAREYARAAEVFERALRTAKVDGMGREMVTRELAELYIHRTNEPGRAVTLLARFLDGNEVDWARTMLRALKAGMR